MNTYERKVPRGLRNPETTGKKQIQLASEMEELFPVDNKVFPDGFTITTIHLVLSLAGQ